MRRLARAMACIGLGLVARPALSQDLPQPEPMADAVGMWGDINRSPGCKGIVVTDWDRDGRREVLVGHDALVVAVRHRERYQFDQRWAVPLGGTSGAFGCDSAGAWGLRELDGDPDDEMWILRPDGELLSYDPFGYTPTALGRLMLGTGDELLRAVMASNPSTGAPELMVLVRVSGQPRLRAYAVPSLSETWQYDLSAGSAWSVNQMVVGQVDADPGPEIVLNTGIVIDRVRGLEQWAYNAGFGKMVIADADGDGRDEIVGAQNGFITAYDIDERSPAWQIQHERAVDAMATGDLTGDGQPELIVGQDQWGDLVVYDLPTHTSLWTVDNAEHGVSGIGVGDADADGQPDLIWGSGWTSTGADHLYLAPAGDRSFAFAFPDYDGPYRAIPLQLDADDGLELVIFTASTNSGYDGGTYLVIDAASGLEEVDLRLDVDFKSSGFDRVTPNPLVANVDGDPFDELILGFGNDMYVLDQGGQRLVKNSFSTPVIPEWVGDADGDGVLDLVSRSQDRVNIHQLDTLEYTWQSVAMSAGVKGVAVGDVDHDGHKDILFHGADSYLQAYDGKTHKLKWQTPPDRRVDAVAVGDADGAGGPEIAVIEDGWLKFYDGTTQALITKTLELPGGDFFGTAGGDLDFAMLGEHPQPQLIVTTRQAVWLLRQPMDATPGQRIALDNPSVVWADTDGDHHMDLVVGSDVGVARYRMREAFPDRVPPLARALVPARGIDLVSRNAFAEASFNEAMDEASITPDHAALRVGDQPLPVRLAYDPRTRVLRLTPEGLLPPDADITVWLGPDLRDVAGNGLDGNLDGIGGEADDAFRWTFKTGAGVDTVGPRITLLSVSPDPVWAGMSVALRATADDTDPAASSVVRGAEYFTATLGAPGTGVPLAAVDKRYDGRIEAIDATVSTDALSGTLVVHVRAVDTVGNWGPARAVTLTVQPEDPGNWPTFGHDPGHSGYSPSHPAVPGYVLAWEKDVGSEMKAPGRAIGPVAAANGLAVVNTGYFFGNGGILALRAADGVELWRREFAEKHSINPATIAYGTVYFQQGNHSSDTHLFALNALTGEERWRAPFGAQWEEYYAPTVADGKVFINGGGYGGMYGFDAFTGRQLWFAQHAQYDQWTPAYSQGTVYSWVAGAFAAWDPKYGTSKWSIDLGWDWAGYDMDRTIAVSDGVAYVTARAPTGGDLIAVDLTTRLPKWRLNGRYTGTPAVADGVVYALDGDTLRAVDAGTHAVRWSFTAKEDLVGAPIVTAGNVYVATPARTWLLDRATGGQVATLPRGGWLTLANRQLYVAQPDGRLAVYREGITPPERPDDRRAFIPWAGHGQEEARARRR